MKILVLLLMVFAALSFSAERVVLWEYFTQTGWGTCASNWSAAKTALNPFVASGDVAPLYLFYNGPASNSFCSGRFSFYGVGSTPTVKIDGLAASATPSSYATAFNNRLAIPSHIDFDITLILKYNGGDIHEDETNTAIAYLISHLFKCEYEEICGK